MPNKHNSKALPEESFVLAQQPSPVVNDTATDTPSTPLVLPDEFTLPVPVLQGIATNSDRRKKARTVRVGGLQVHWERFKKRVGTDSPSTSSLVDASMDSSQRRLRTEEEVDSDEVDEIVVDRDWSDDIKSSLGQSEHGTHTPEKSKESHSHHPLGGGTATSVGPESSALHDDRRFLVQMFILLRWGVWPAVQKFFQMRFYDEKTENRFRREHWFIRKHLGLWSAIFFIVNWIVGAATIPPPRVTMDDIFFFGVGPVFSLPLLVLVIFDFPRDRVILWQTYLVVCIWCWGYYEILFMRLCGHYGGHSYFTCGTKNFLATFYYTSGLQTIALFGLKLNRMAAAGGAIFFFVSAGIIILPVDDLFIRDLINFLVYHTFLLFVHYMNENSERRLFILREQLKVQFKATQKAQINERKEVDSKRRLTSYVFHVRVPLNTALLAVQNMEASDAVAKSQELEFMALEGSLVMMSKVLNDMLDFNRMDSGRFEILSKPYAFHAVIRSLLVPLRMATTARNLELITVLDKNIDLVARRAALEATGQDVKDIQKQLDEKPDEDGVVVGDAIRLRQIINNLASNACKFTPSGGRVTCTTRLVFPVHVIDTEPHEHRVLSSTDGQHEIHVEDPVPSSSAQREKQTTAHSKAPVLRRIVVRIEVNDTGSGIPPREMAQGKLFSAFNQTEQGRQQGGKGTGLGLALVRQIVKLSGGRLGVRSKLGHGSSFWVELPLGVGMKVLDVTDTALMFSEKAAPTVELAGPLSTELIMRHERHTSTPNNLSDSALKTLMDQGGFVELQLDGMHGDPDSPVLTRTIDDLSSGTQLRPPPNGSFRSTPQDETLPESGATTSVEESPPEPGSSSVVPKTNGAFLPPSFATDLLRPRKTPLTVFEPPIDVLVVDDDRLTRTIMSRTLTRLGCNVCTAENGGIAFQLLTGEDSSASSTPQPREDEMASSPLEQADQNSSRGSHSFDIVFLDNQMPVMSGLELISKLRERGRKDLVIGVTGNALIDDQREYIGAGVDHVLTKPVFEPSLVKMLTIADERRKHRTGDEAASSSASAPMATPSQS